jgi:hypothetical protein
VDELVLDTGLTCGWCLDTGLTCSCTASALGGWYRADRSVPHLFDLYGRGRRVADFIHSSGGPTGYARAAQPCKRVLVLIMNVLARREILSVHTFSFSPSLSDIYIHCMRFFRFCVEPNWTGRSRTHDMSHMWLLLEHLLVINKY